MIRRNIREWDYLPIEAVSGPDSLTRAAADRLVEVARSTNIGGEDGERILINGAKRLRAQQVVGVLVAKGVSLEILPKIDGADDIASTRRSLVHMLATVFDLKVATGAIADLDWQQDDLLEILIRLFCAKLFEALHRGLPRQYIGHNNDLTALRGRLDVKRQFTSLAASPQKLACVYDELSADIALNRIIKAAIIRLSTVARSPDNQRNLYELALAFSDIGLVSPNVLPWHAVILDRTNDAWRELLNFAKMLFDDRFQTTTSGKSRGVSLLFEMNTLFEEFVGRTLKRAFAGTGVRIELQGPADNALVDHNTGKGRFATRPDIVISRNSERLLVIDTKWKRLKGAIYNPKRGVGQSDVYQMMAYSHVYHCEHLMLLYPHHSEMGDRDGIVKVHRIANRPDSRFSIATLSLDEPKSAGARLKNLIFETGAILGSTGSN